MPLPPRCGQAQASGAQARGRTEKDDRGEPGHVSALQRRFLGPFPKPMQPRPHKREPEAGTEVKDTGEEPRVYCAQEELGQGRARAEERGGGKRERYPREAVHGSHTSSLSLRTITWRERGCCVALLAPAARSSSRR